MYESRFINGHELHYSTTPAVRAGVIPYTIYNNQLYFLLGIDRKTRELTDFGGGVKSTEGLLEAAYRELHEETCGMFAGRVTRQHLQNSLLLLTKKRDTGIFFLYIDPRWTEVAERVFSANQQKLNSIKKYNELIGIKWIRQTDFHKIAFDRNSRCMWRRIQNILHDNTTWEQLWLHLRLGLNVARTLKDLARFSRYTLQNQMAREMELVAT